MSLVNTDASVLVLDLVAQTVDSGDMLITLKFSGVKHRANVVGVALESVVLVSPLLEVSDSIAVPGVGTLELVLKATLLVQELRTLVLEDADALVGVGDLLGLRIESIGKVTVPTLVVAKISGHVAEVATEPFDVAESIVTLSVGIMDLSVLRFELGETSIVVKLQARKLGLERGVVFAYTVLWILLASTWTMGELHQV